MNKKHIAYIVLGMVLLGTIATLSISMVAAQDDDVIVGQDQFQTHQGQGEKTYRFRQRTRVRINASQNLNLNMSIEALEIGDRTFSLDMESESGHEWDMNMWAVRDQDRLGLQNGSTIRHQHRHQIRNNFAVQMQVNETVRTRIGMEMSRGDATRASWAYYDEPTNEWVEVESSYEDGMLVADTELIAASTTTWTITESASLTGLWVSIGVGVAGLGALGAILIRKKRM
ncbi:MAG: hypothetical protein ACTSRE_03715 [Promethearchaeota archaeon]